jgi:transposase
VLGKRLWGRVLRVDRASIEDVRFDEHRVTTDEGETIEAAVIVSVRTYADERRRCGICRRRSPKFDNGVGRRRWRTPDVGCQPCFLEADTPRVTCKSHGVVVAAVAWARHGSRFTKDFEDQVAWLAAQSSGFAVAELMRISWRSVGRVVADARARRDPLDGLTRIGIDEISHRKGHRYLVVVVDHDTGRLVGRPRAGRGHRRAVLRRPGAAAGRQAHPCERRCRLLDRWRRRDPGSPGDPVCGPLTRNAA